MKRGFVSVLFLTVMLIGCSSTSETLSNQNVKANTNESVDSSILAEEEIEEERKEDDRRGMTNGDNAVTVNSSNPYNAVRIPETANFSFMKTSLSSLDAAKNWGDALDIRQADLSAIDLTNEFDILNNLVFDTATVWPDKLPQGFDPISILETGKNAGLGIRALQEKGITGKGVNIAIVDYTLLVDHEEYCNQIKLYDEVNSSVMAEMHGPFVASLSVGKTVGVAPDAGLYFIGTNNVTTVNNERVIDYTNYADSINKIIEINKNLPKDQKIRALSISATWCPDNKGYKEMTEAVEKAKADGIFVISCNLFETYGFWTYSLEKNSYSDPDDSISFKPYEWRRWINMVSNVDGFIPFYEESFSNKFQGEMLLVPIGSRTTASPTGQNDYFFSTDGGWSAMEPYLAGLYAMACQVKPDITPELFWQTALETGDSQEITKENQTYPARLLNPEKMVQKLQE